MRTKFYTDFSKIVFLIIFNLSLVSCNQNKDKINNSNYKIQSFPGFEQTDIGKVNTTGIVTLNKNKNEIEIIAGGSDIWGTQDSFYFNYKKLKGDFVFTTQILSFKEAHQYSKAGIMARTDLSNSSQHVYFQVYYNNSYRNNNNGGCEFQYRENKGNKMKAIYPDQNKAKNTFNVSFPYTWIRLKRNGNVFESYISNDNKIWKLYSSFSLNMPGELLVGFAITAHDIEKVASIKFALPEIMN